MLYAYPVPGKAKSKMLCEAFIAGAPSSAKGAVFYGVKAGNAEAWRAVKRSGEDFYWIDNSYLDQTRGVMFRVTKNALQCTSIVDGDAMTDGRRLPSIELKPWREFDAPGYTLIVEQSQDHMDYVIDNASEFYTLSKFYQAKHRTKVRRWCADKPQLMTTLADDLAGANQLVTHTSAAAVMAILAGVPVICNQHCVAFGMNYAHDIDRLRWAGLLADNQFSIDELMNGTAWQAVNR